MGSDCDDHDDDHDDDEDNDEDNDEDDNDNGTNSAPAKRKKTESWQQVLLPKI